MISWIQKYFHRHFRLIFLIMLIAMVVPLVWIFNTSSGIGGADRHVIERRVFGYNLGSQEDQSRLFGDAALSAQLQAGYPVGGAELETYALRRAATLELANQLHIPATTKQELTDYIKTLRVFAGPDGQFDPARYTAFRDSLKHNGRMDEGMVSRVLGEEVRTSKVEKLLSGPGYVLPGEVRGFLEQADTMWTLGVATVDYASYNPVIPVNDAVLTKYFEDNAFRYEIPPRADTSYVEFPADAYLATVTVTEADVRSFYDANPARFPRPAADAKNAKRDSAADYAAVRPQVESALKLERAKALAAKAASDFSFTLYERKLAPGTPAFETYLTAQRLTLKKLAPFTQEAGPAELGGSAAIAAEAFKLGPDRLFSDAITAPTGAVVLFWHALEPARKPSLLEVRAKVAADYTENEKRKQFVELGRTLRAALEAAVKQGQSFEAAAASVGTAKGVRIEAKKLPAFSRRQPPQDTDYSVFGALERLEKGAVSDMIIAREHGLLVYAQDKKLPDTSPASPEFASARNQLSFATARVAANGYLDDRIATELKNSEPKQE